MLIYLRTTAINTKNIFSQATNLNLTWDRKISTGIFTRIAINPSENTFGNATLYDDSNLMVESNMFMSVYFGYNVSINYFDFDAFNP